MADIKLPLTPADKQRLFRIRAKVKYKKPISAEEATWYANYENAKTAREQQSHGRSAHRRRTVHVEEESGASEGHGSSTAAEVAAAAAYATAEGQREDSLARVALDTYKACTADLRATMTELRLRAKEDGDLIRSILQDHRAAVLESTELEAEAIRREAEVATAKEGGDDAEMMKFARMIAPFLGIKLPEEETKPNGKKKAAS